MQLRKAEDRGKFENAWLRAKYTFSFSSYNDADWMGFGNLRVLNHDQVQPLGGFQTHGHKDMEIVTYIIRGSIEHKDSMGNIKVIKAGEVQRMTAGTGVEHSEVNPSSSDVLELFQIWFLPKEKNLAPDYEQKLFSRKERLNTLKLVASHEGGEGHLKLNAKAKMWASVLEANQSLEFVPELDGVWLQIASGELRVDDKSLKAGDGLALDSAEGQIKIEALSEAEFIMLGVNRSV